MKQSPEMTPDEYDDALDKEADKLGSYDLARRELGEPPYETVDTSIETFVIPGQEPAKRELGRRAVSGNPNYHPSRGPRGEEEGVGLPNDEPLYRRKPEDAILSPKQVEINQRGLAEVRKVISEAAANKEKR